MTKDQFQSQFLSGDLLDEGNRKTILRSMSAFMYDKMLKWGGEATAATLEAMADPTKLEVYKITTGGSITSGSLTTATGDLVYYDGSVWKYMLDKV